MRTTYTHLLLTRFNVRESEENWLALDGDWLDRRFELFDKYCFPSIKNQSDKNFKWIILFDGKTPERYKSLEKGYQERAGVELHFEYIDGYYVYANNAQVLSKYITEGSEYLVTSRVDSDDALASDYIETVHKSLKFTGKREFLSFSNGLQYFSEKGLLYKVRYTKNHFTTMVEPVRDGRGEAVINFDHTVVDGIGVVKPIKSDHPMWIEIVHGGNIINDYTPAYRYSVCRNADTDKNFGFETWQQPWLKSRRALRGMRVDFIMEQVKRYRLVISNYLYGTSANAINALISLVILPYVIRALGVEGYGIYAFAFIIANTIIQIESTPFNLPFGRDVAAAKGNLDEKSRIFSRVMSAKLLLIAVTSAIFLPIVLLIPQTEPYRLPLVILFASILGNPFMPNWYYQAIQKTKVIAYIQVSIRLLSLPFIFLFIKGPEHIVRFAIIYTACTLLSALISYIYLKRKELLPITLTPFKTTWSAITRCVPTLLDSISEMLTKNIAGILVGSVFGMVEMAWYDLAGKIIQILNYGINGINNALMPHVIAQDNKSTTRKLIYSEAVLGILIVAAVALLGKPVIWLLGGDGMGPAYLITLILSLALVADFISDGIVYLYLIPANRLKEVPYGRYIALGVFLLFCPFINHFTYIYLIIAILIASLARFAYLRTLLTRDF